MSISKSVVLSLWHKATAWVEEQDIWLYRPACTEQDSTACVSRVYVTRTVQNLTISMSANKCT